MNNQNFAATMYNAVFPILNTAQVYLGYGCSRETTKVAFCEAFQECQSILEKGEGSYLEPEWYIEQFKKWAKQTEEIIFMSLLSYHPEKFYPQQINALPESSEFWEGMYQKEQWEEYDEAQHPFDRWYEVSEFHNEIN